MKVQKLFLAAIFTVIFAAGSAQAANSGGESPDKPNGSRLDKCDATTDIGTSGVIEKDVDGDTVHVTTKAGTFSLRMLGMDTPETHFMGRSQGAWGDKAAAILAQLLPVGSQVRLEFGTDSCDDHGRVLAHIFKGKMHVNAEMVKMGLAVNYCVAPDFTYCDDFSRYAYNAIQRGFGMFSDPNLELPYDFRRRVQNKEQRSYVGNIVTKVVFAPGHQNEVPISSRVFFYSADAIQEPYRLQK